MSILSWNCVNNVNIRNESGIYAWYYPIDIGEFDVRKITETLTSSQDQTSKHNEIKKFLEKHLFSYFKEDDYQVVLQGKLKPEYRGNICHLTRTSDSLIEKIIEKPMILYELKKIIDSLSIEFSSPIYIGMSNNLQQRLSKHKQLIEDFKTQTKTYDNFENRDESFAARVVSRGMIETKLKVSIKYIPADENLNNIMENILNRINYPILGRN